jgi:hypothetical protein
MQKKLEFNGLIFFTWDDKIVVLPILKGLPICLFYISTGIRSIYSKLEKKSHLGIWGLFFTFYFKTKRACGAHYVFMFCLQIVAADFRKGRSRNNFPDIFFDINLFSQVFVLKYKKKTIDKYKFRSEETQPKNTTSISPD